MNKTILRKVHLVNWYGFGNTTIPVSECLTLISGENECGKSTILDAIKYAYTGDTQFNKATSGYNTGVGKRNLLSYTRCLVDASAGIYARPAEKIPVVYTHIALEYFDQINENPFVLGVVIETAVTDIRGTHWYVSDGSTLKDIAFVYEEDAVKKPYDASGFQKRNGVQMKNKKEGITLFMQMTGLKLPYQEVPKYQRKLRNIMAYNPAAKIQEFIKESVLEEHDVNFDKLKEAKKNIEQINSSLEQIDQELKDLESILEDYDEHDKKSFQLKVDDIKIKYKKQMQCQREIREAEDIVKEGRITCETLEKRIREQYQEIDEIDRYYSETKRALRDLDVSKAIDASQQLIHTYEEQLAVLDVEKERLEIFQKRMQEAAARLRESGAGEMDANMAGLLVSKKIEAAEKQRFIDTMKEEIRKRRDHLIEERILLKKESEDIRKECIEQTEIIENCNKNRTDHSRVREQLELIREINLEFKRQGIPDEAHMACEYVVELKDENWRNAIETFLGIHRYAIIVAPSSFDVANAVLDRSGHRYVELVNTKRLVQKETECKADSVFHYLYIQNETAAEYFKYWLGRIHAVELEDVPKYDNAMSKEGKLSRSMAVTYMNMKKIKSYCLGNQAIELNKRAAERKLKELEARENEIMEKQENLQEDAEYLRISLDHFKEYDLNAHREAAQVSASLEEERGHYQELIEAQEQNEEFMALNERVTELGRQLEQKKRAQTENLQKKTILETTISEKERRIKMLKAEEEEKRKELEEERSRNHSAAKRAVEEYDGYLSGENPGGGLMQYEMKQSEDRRVRELEGDIRGKQQSYNNRKQEEDRLPVGLEYEAAYQRRRGKIWIEDLQGIQKKMKEQTITYERIFKREFVLNIYEAAKDARSDIADINKELRKLQFSTRYQFDVKLLNDHSDYAKILRYAEYLQETNNMLDGQFAFTGLMGYENDEVETREKEIRDIINKIIDQNDMTQMKRFADYRNYMSYEIIINNDEVKDGKLSKQVGYNSGAGTQIPYTLILSAALSMLYNVRVNSVRLIFIDEPFEKMSDHNIKLMLDFFKNQHFQVIFCAPPNKLESIGNECGVIIPVLKVSNDNMQIGKVKFHV